MTEMTGIYIIKFDLLMQHQSTHAHIGWNITVESIKILKRRIFIEDINLQSGIQCALQVDITFLSGKPGQFVP